MQEHNPEHKNTGGQVTPNHRHFKTHYLTLLCTPERRDPAPLTRTQTEASLTRNPDKPLIQSHPQGGTSTIKRNKNHRIQKGHPKHSNINKMKMQINTQQEKEHDKCPPNQTKEEEIGSLSEKEFRIMIVKMIQNLENKMEL